ncbi:TonB-dependent receptor plug domain-containing protein [Ekhidna sp.]
MKKNYLLAAIVCSSMAVKAQDSLKVVRLDDVVVTGNKVETTIEKSGKTIYKLDREQIQTNKGKDITDLLNEIPGVQIDGNYSTPGSNINYRVRGAQSEQTLILIDGIPFNDPSGLQQTFDLRQLDLNQVESIEVLKGGLSTLYGSGAAAGIINITLKKASKERINGSVSAEYGSFNTISSNATVSGKSDKFNFMVSGSIKSSDGFSAAKDTLENQGFDDDGIQSLNFLGKLGYQFSEQFSMGLLAGYDKIESDFDAGTFRDNDSELELELLKFALSSNYKWSGGSIKGNISYHTNERVFNSPGFFDPSVRDISNFNGNTFQTDFLLDQNLTDQVKLIGGINLQRPVWEPEEEDSESFTMVDPYLSFIYDTENFNIQLGGRLNNHSLYGSNFVWNINPSYMIDLESQSLKILGSYATSFLTPSLNQLFAGDFGFLASDAGNPDLSPQESKSAEAGFELLSDGKFQFGAVYFYRKDKNLIDFVSNDTFTDGMYENIEGEIEVDGLEINASFSFNQQFSISGHYTHTNSLTEDLILRRVPQDKFGIVFSAIPIEKLFVKVTHLYTGETNENDEVSVDAFNTFDLFASYTLNQLTFSGSINNIFNEDFVERFGFATAQRNFNIGVRYSF